MNTRLNSILDWEELAHRAGYQAARLASLCLVCERQLRRFLQRRFGQPARVWLQEQRMRRALRMLRNGARAKEVAEELRFKRASHFSAAFKRFFGIQPSQTVQLALALPKASLFQARVRF